MDDPHLTPRKLLGSDVLPEEWKKAKVAFVCFTPFPNGFKKYVLESATDRYFLHSPNAEVRLCEYAGTHFIVISEVYGFAVGATTVEELVHHGVQNIIGIGFVGAFNQAPLGQPFVATATMSDLPLAEHYGMAAHQRCEPSQEISEVLNQCIKDDSQNWGRYMVWTSNSLYRESPHAVQQMKDLGCEVVNMDTLAIYAVGPVCVKDAQHNVQYIYVGTVTDSMEKENQHWNSDLLDAVKGKRKHPHDGLVKFMVQALVPQLASSQPNS